MSDTICSFCGREKNEVDIPRQMKTKDGKRLVTVSDALYLLLLLSHKDFKYKVINKERKLVREGPNLMRLDIPQYNMCSTCKKAAMEIIPQQLVRRFPMKGGW